MLQATPLDTISSMNAPYNGSVMMFDGRAFAVGLLWLTVQDDGERNLLQERIKKTKADFYCQRMHIAQQHGFAWLEKGHRRGMPAAAAMVADQLVGEWHGVFEADNGWWYVQVRSDTIMPNGDRFFASEEDAFQVFQEEAQKNIWPHSYAPERWRLTDTQTRELSLRNLLDDLTTTTLIPTNLTAMMGSALIRNVVLACILLCVLVMGGVVVHTITKPPPEIQPSRVRTTQTAQLAKPKKNLLEIISPQQLVQQCGKAADQLYQPIAGWVTEQFVCSAGKASMTWRQGTGSLGAARDAGAGRWPSDAVITVKDRQMTVHVLLGNLPKLEAQNLVPQETALLYLEQNLQSLGSLNVKPVTPRPKKEQPASRSARNRNTVPVVEAPEPSYLDIKFNSGFGPDHVASLLQVPGMELVNVQWRIPQAVWQYDLKWIYDMPQAAKKTGDDAQAKNTGARSTRNRTTQEKR